MVDSDPFLFWKPLLKLFCRVAGRLGILGPADSIADAVDVRVDGHSFHFLISVLECKVRHFGANARQSLEVFQIVRHFATVSLVDDLSGLLDILCLFVVEADFRDPLVQDLSIRFQDCGHAEVFLVDEELSGRMRHFVFCLS